PRFSFVRWVVLIDQFRHQHPHGPRRQPSASINKFGGEYSRQTEADQQCWARRGSSAAMIQRTIDSATPAISSRDPSMLSRVRSIAATSALFTKRPIWSLVSKWPAASTTDLAPRRRLSEGELPSMPMAHHGRI